jgi:serine/threonine-protein kinase PRP4
MNDNAEPSPLKRPRMEVAATRDEEDLSAFMDDNDFATEEKRREDEAERRRLQRRRRLQQLENEEATAVQQESVKADAGIFQTTTIGAGELKKQPTESLVRKMAPPNNEEQGGTKDYSDDEFDMFSNSASPVAMKTEASATSTSTKRGHDQEDWDDVEGYYKAVIGEVISLLDSAISLQIMGSVGKGVFSTVIKCSTVSNSSSMELPPTVAIKLIRHNETMAKAAQNELLTLQKLKGSPGIVPLLMPTGLSPLEHRGHVVMVFSFMEYNLRDVLQKFGKGVGLSLQAVRSYFGQLLAASTHLQKHGIIHADLKPDNILVSSDFGVVQLADFGSAIHIASPEQSQVTPYLVSRFYRAPEIILGLTPTYAVDLWSLAVSVAEVFLGDCVFKGKSNNDMLYVFMQHLGAFSNRIIRQHVVQCQRMPIARHFQQEGANYVFTLQTVDPVSGSAVHKVLSLLPQNNTDQKFPLGTPLKQKVLKAKSANDSRKMVLNFADLLQQCLALDPTRRIALKDALRHEFFQATKSNPTTSST